MLNVKALVQFFTLRSLAEDTLGTGELSVKQWHGGSKEYRRQYEGRDGESLPGSWTGWTGKALERECCWKGTFRKCRGDDPGKEKAAPEKELSAGHWCQI